MRILDKYLLRELAAPVVYCFDAFAMLGILLDLFGNLDDFLQAHAPVGQVIQYYVFLFPEIFVTTLPMSLLLGLLFCLSNLSKHNELAAMRAGGISVMRLSLPLLAVGFAASLLVLGSGEALVPRARERAGALMNKFKGRGQADVLENFFFSNDLKRQDWYARRFNTRTREMENPEIHAQNPDGSPLLDVYAEHASWIAGTWHFYNCDVHDSSHASLIVTHVAETNFPSVNDSPSRLALEGKKPDQMTSRELRRYIRTQQRLGLTNRLALYQVALHSRYSFPLTCLVVMWMGIPLGMRVGRSGALVGAGTALALVVTYYVLSYLTQALGNGGWISPILAAWTTNVIFVGVGGLLFVNSR